MFGLKLAALLLFTCLSATAQVNVVPVNGGTGSLVSIPIPGGSGLSVTVGTGSAALPLQEIKNHPGAVNITTGDDDLTHVPLGFDFPFYGRVFNNSWAMTNGLVTFQDPWQSGLGGACCEGVDLRTTTSSAYNYTIFGMHSDLYSWNGQNQYYLRGNNEMTYGWYNTSQCCSGQGGNSFEIKINSLGLVDTRIAGAMISGNRVTSGMAGNLANGEYFQAYHGSGLNIIPGSANIFSWQALNGTGAVDMCTINPISSPSCPGYQAAYTVQQCTISALYDPTCPGYAAAYTSQQCSANPLYSTSCPGYQSAYLQQQCSANPLYSTTCQGYARAYHDQQCSVNTLYATDCPGYAAAYLTQQCNANPLYSTTCQGYASAYHDQQCSINPLYSTTCSGYAVAYKTQQCTASPLYATDCPGYETAYKTQQCTANPLYATDCPGYAVAYKAQQCTASALYATDCPGYAEAYFSQQCTANGLYNNQCPNYSEAYAKKMLLEQQGIASTVATAGTVAQVAQVAAVAAADPANATATATSSAISSDSNVAAAVVVKPPSAAGNETAPAAAVKLTPPPPPPAMQMAQAEPKKDNAGPGERKEEKKEEGNKQNANGPNSGGPSGDSKPSDQPKSNREALQERRAEAAKKEAVAKAGNLANEMGKAADMEAQKAVQNVVIQAMGFTPGFDTYNRTMIPDTVFYKPYTVYGNQRVIDNRVLSRGLTGGSDRTHQDMVDSQYNRGN